MESKEHFATEPAHAAKIAGGIALLAAVCAALLVPIWLVTYPPLLDYPDHLARSFILAHINDPAFRFPEFYRADWGPYPYIGMDVILVALQHFAPAAIAGKIFLSLCAIAVPLAAWWLIREANPGNDGLALWALLLSLNPFFLEGFLSFQLGLALCFVTVGAWVRCLRRPSPKLWTATLALATATYFAHLIAFFLAAFIVAVFTAAEKRRAKDVGAAGLIFAPGVVLYFLSGIGGYNGHELAFRAWSDKAADGLGALVHGYSQRLEWFTLASMAACVVIAWVRNPAFKIQRPWVAVAAGLVLLYSLLPNGFGEAWDVDVRVMPALLVVLLLSAQIGKRQWALAAIALLLFGLRTADVARNFVREQADLAPMEQAIQAIPQDARVLPMIHENDDDDPLLRLYPHFWAYSIIERGVRAPGLFDLRGQTPMRITDRLYLPDLSSSEPLDLAAMRRDYDYAWVWNYPQWTAQLASAADLVYQNGPLQLYRLTGTGHTQSTAKVLPDKTLQRHS